MTDVRRRLTELRDWCESEAERQHKRGHDDVEDGVWAYQHEANGQAAALRIVFDKLDALVRQIPQEPASDKICETCEHAHPPETEYLYLGTRGCTHPDWKQYLSSCAFVPLRVAGKSFGCEGWEPILPSSAGRHRIIETGNDREPAALDGRIVALARDHAIQNHCDGLANSPGGGGHVGDTDDDDLGFSTCPHPDCVLVRTLDVKGETVP